ncbi:MAG: glycosyltransferase [Acidimicrobiales bacterium]
MAAIDEPSVLHPYGSEVRWRIRQGDPESYLAAAHAINASKTEVVNVQHEFGLYGTWGPRRMSQGRWVDAEYEDHLGPLLEALHKPVVTTLHTVLPRPDPSLRAAVRSIFSRSTDVIVMASTAIGILADDYGITDTPKVIHHGMPVIEPHGRIRLKSKLGVEGRTIVATFGLIDPGKGLEYMIQAMPEVVLRHPNALYLIAGQTHPDLLRTEGEKYRNTLVELVRALDIEGHVAFIDQYMSQHDVIEFLLAADVYVTPYLDPNQITSGTLSYALGAGKAVVSTAYLHAAEALADGRGILVGFRDSAQLAAGVITILDDPERKHAMEQSAFAYSRSSTWPLAAESFIDVAQGAIDAANLQARPRRHVTYVGPDMGRRLTENPILTAADVPPSQPSLEVVSVLNAAAARIGDETILLLRVGERPRIGMNPPDGAMTLDLSGPDPRLRSLPEGISGDRLVGLAFLDTQHVPVRVVNVFLPRDLDGLDLSDPRTIRYHRTAGGFNDREYDFTDFLTQMSHLRVARSRDGVNFEVEPTPAVSPANAFEEYGCEDPRATLIDGVWHITYVSVSRLGITTSRLTTTDFRTFERHGVMFLPDHKDVVLFPERIGGRYVALTRPMPGSFDRVLGTWVAFSEDLIHWGTHHPVAMPRWGMWDELRTGGSCVPFRVPEGWLEIYHGVDRNRQYALGGLLLDAEDPTKVIARSPEPILRPIEPYERTGLFNDTVFSCGHVALPGRGNQIRVYYGAADSCMAAADFKVSAILAQLDPC